MGIDEKAFRAAELSYIKTGLRPGWMADLLEAYEAAKETGQPVEKPPSGYDTWQEVLDENAEYERILNNYMDEVSNIDAFLFRLGKPHLKTAFRGDGNPTDDQLARAIGASIMEIYLGFAKKIEDIDAPKRESGIADAEFLSRIERALLDVQMSAKNALCEAWLPDPRPTPEEVYPMLIEALKIIQARGLWAWAEVRTITQIEDGSAGA